MPVNRPCAASIAVWRDWQMMTPLPAASPSALTTIGGWKMSTAFSSSAAAGADGVVGGGDVVPLQKALGEALAGLEHGGLARGAEDAQAALLKRVDDAQRKRQLRPDDGQSRAARPRPRRPSRPDPSDPPERSAQSGRCRRFPAHKPPPSPARCASPPRPARVRVPQNPRIKTFMCLASCGSDVCRTPEGYGRQCGRGKSNRRSTAGSRYAPLY